MPKVLIIEDSDRSLRVLRDAFRNDPAWEFLVAVDGERGLALALQHLATLQAIVLDVVRPRIDGPTLLQHLRLVAPRLPIIAIASDPAIVDEMKVHGATLALAPPIAGDHFAAVLRAVIPPTAYRVPLQPDTFSFDRTPVPQMQARDLDLDRVNQHIRAAIERRRYDGPLDWQEFLLAHGGIIDGGGVLRPTVAGALTFAPRPERWLIAHGIDIAEFAGDKAHSTSLRFQQPVRGNIFTVIERTVDLLWARTEHASALDPQHGITQIQHDAYPHVVLRELTVNAVCHRDWSIEGAVIRIQLFPDRIEWISPGGLPPGVSPTVEGLRNSQVARNPALAQLLYQASVIERFGLGLDTVFDTLNAHGHPPPEVIDHGRAFVIRVFAKPLAQPARPQRHLTERQRRIQHALADQEELTAMELAEVLGEPLRNVQRDLAELLAVEAISAIGQTRKRRYRLAPNDRRGAN